MPRSRPRFSALLNFPGAEYGPLALRPLLRERLGPGERIVGWSDYRGDLPFHRAAIAFALAIMPIGHLLAGFIARVERGVIVLTDRRILLLTHENTGPDPAGSGVRANWPLETISVSATVGAREHLLRALQHYRSRPRTPAPAEAPTADRRATPADPRQLLGAASLFIITQPDGRSLTLKVSYLSGKTASGRLREGLVLLAGGTLTEHRETYE